jgi:hypothetical protein
LVKEGFTQERFMADRATAKIIPFPARPPSEEAGERLARALAGLQAALAAQQEAVTGWRHALGELQVGMRGLLERTRQYQARLRMLDAGVSGLHAQAQRLKDWTDRQSAPIA